MLVNNYIFTCLCLITELSSQTITASMTSEDTHADWAADLYAGSKAIDGSLVTNFRTERIPSGLILTLAQSMLIRRVRIFTGKV